jgi:uncharacterized membrane protein YcaP (DUF421 family)
MVESMFHLHLPIVEKILRPVIVYLVLVAFLRLFGKRELAQLNPFDLVVLLSLSNAVQNAIIGDDNTVTGGVIGAFALLTINWVLTRVLFYMPKLNQVAEGSATTLICDGVVDEAALKKETLTREELLSVLHKQSYDNVSEVRMCVLEPNGTFYIEGMQPSSDDAQRAEVLEALERLTREVQDLKAQLGGIANRAAQS